MRCLSASRFTCYLYHSLRYCCTLLYDSTVTVCMLKLLSNLIWLVPCTLMCDTRTVKSLLLYFHKLFHSFFGQQDRAAKNKINQNKVDNQQTKQNYKNKETNKNEIRPMFRVRDVLIRWERNQKSQGKRDSIKSSIKL